MSDPTQDRKSLWPFSFSEEQARALFLLAGIPVLTVWQIENGYWPTAYIEERTCSPWFLMKTDYGMIEIGWRKRVIQIDWRDTGRELEVTDDNVTKEPFYIHAWSYLKALEYLTNIGSQLRRPKEQAA